MNRFWPVTVAAFLGGSSTGCHHLPVAPLPAGKTSFAFVEPSGRSGPNEPGVVVSEENAHFRAPIILNDLAAPLYPPAALAAHARATTIDVQLTVGIAGQISDVSPNAVDLAVLGRFAPAYEEAIDGAVAQWRFHPAEIVHFERGSDPGSSYLRVTSTEPVPAQLEVKFTFTEGGQVIFNPTDR